MFDISYNQNLARATQYIPYRLSLAITVACLAHSYLLSARIRHCFESFGEKHVNLFVPDAYAFFVSDIARGSPVSRSGKRSCPL